MPLYDDQGSPYYEYSVSEADGNYQQIGDVRGHGTKLDPFIITNAVLEGTVSKSEDGAVTDGEGGPVGNALTPEVSSVTTEEGVFFTFSAAYGEEPLDFSRSEMGRGVYFLPVERIPIPEDQKFSDEVEAVSYTHLNCPGVTLQNMTISGDLIIAPGATGAVTMEAVTVKGSIRNFSGIEPVTKEPEQPLSLIHL